MRTSLVQTTEAVQSSKILGGLPNVPFVLLSAHPLLAAAILPRLSRRRSCGSPRRHAGDLTELPTSSSDRALWLGRQCADDGYLISTPQFDSLVYFVLRMSGSKITSSRISWRDPSRVKFFLDHCISEVARVGRAGSSLRRESWAGVARHMKDKYKVTLSQKQMKNEFDYLRMMYIEWCNLIHECTLSKNSVTNTVDWPADKWAEYLKNHPKAAVFRMSGFKWVEEGRVLFEGISAPGEFERGAASKNPMSCTTKPISSAPLTISSSVGHAIEENSIDVVDESQPSLNNSDTMESEMRSERSLKRGKKCIAVIDQKFVRDVDLVIKDKNEAYQQCPASQVAAPSTCYGTTLIGCCKMMDEIGLSPADDLYVQSAVIFSEKEIREQWIQWCEITKDTLPRIKWLENMVKLKKLA